MKKPEYFYALRIQENRKQEGQIQMPTDLLLPFMGFEGGYSVKFQSLQTPHRSSVFDPWDLLPTLAKDLEFLREDLVRFLDSSADEYVPVIVGGPTVGMERKWNSELNCPVLEFQVGIYVGRIPSNMVSALPSHHKQSAAEVLAGLNWGPFRELTGEGLLHLREGR